MQPSGLLLAVAVTPPVATADTGAHVRLHARARHHGITSMQPGCTSRANLLRKKWTGEAPNSSPLRNAELLHLRPLSSCTVQQMASGGRLIRVGPIAALSPNGGDPLNGGQGGLAAPPPELTPEQQMDQLKAALAAAQEEAAALRDEAEARQRAEEAVRAERDSISEEVEELKRQLAAAHNEIVSVALTVEQRVGLAREQEAEEMLERAHKLKKDSMGMRLDVDVELDRRVMAAMERVTQEMEAEAKEAIASAEAAMVAAEERAAQIEEAYKAYVRELDRSVIGSNLAISLGEKLAAAERDKAQLSSQLRRAIEQEKLAKQAAEVATSQLAKLDENAKIQLAKAEEAAELRIAALNEALEVTKQRAQTKVQEATMELTAEASTARMLASKAKQEASVRSLAAQREVSAMKSVLASTDAALKMWRTRATVAEALLEEMRAYENVCENNATDDEPGASSAEAQEMKRLLDDKFMKQRALKLENSRLRKVVGSDKMLRQLIAEGPRVKPGNEVVTSSEYVPLEMPSPDMVLDFSKFESKALPELEVEAVVPLKQPETEVPAVPTPLIVPSPLIVLPEGARKQKGRTGISREEVKRRGAGQDAATGTGEEIVFQGFHWDSSKSKWYRELMGKAADIAEMGFTSIWLPPPTASVSNEGYMPVDYYNLNSKYGTEEELRYLIEELHSFGLTVLGDVVLNHRCATQQSSDGTWNIFKTEKCNWGPNAIVRDDPNFRGQGNHSSGDFFTAAPNIDHSQPFVQKDICEWLRYLRDDIGYDGWRLDFVRGFWGGHVKTYIESSSPVFAIGEYWDAMSYMQAQMEYNQDAHRQRIINWINATGGLASAFDVTTKGILGQALGSGEYYRLKDARNKPPGVMGWWPSRAVTFLENHDTGSTQVGGTCTKEYTKD
eukprot:jgi/Mesvir1/6225/Mv00904-RA.2